ncbi:MAG TPA: TIGR04282 family arsenosugar biosynthesis glycosyltransferase [Ktedonobacteraceae bacterium]|nr:TIGR04282 family arsenosugar biosynthesis glycosyltransferase [Ktedonobacteraceae bacterium]
MRDTALIIMARYPQVGTTKTRLACSIGNEATLLLYKAFLTDLARKFAGQIADLYWAYTPLDVNYASFIATLVPSLAHHMHYFPQQGTGLGERLLHAFQRMYASGYKRTIIIGSDSPHIRRDIIATACQALDDADVVLGPADDGGYYLIAMRQPYDVFRGIPMSTSKVARMTIDLAQSQHLKVSMLETLFDIDELPDVLRLGQLLRADSSLAPVTAALLLTGNDMNFDNRSVGGCRDRLPESGQAPGAVPTASHA